MCVSYDELSTCYFKPVHKMQWSWLIVFWSTFMRVGLQQIDSYHNSLAQFVLLVIRANNLILVTALYLMYDRHGLGYRLRKYSLYTDTIYNCNTYVEAAWILIWEQNGTRRNSLPKRRIQASCRWPSFYNLGARCSAQWDYCMLQRNECYNTQNKRINFLTIWCFFHP